MTEITSLAENVISLEGISIRYRKPGERIRTLKEYVIRILQRRLQFKEFYALKDVNLQIQQGEILGVIGNNGAGKSTLLKVISRVLVPTQGRVWIRGVVTPLLELGAGFHPELTGRENIYLNGAILGHPVQEIDGHMEEIIRFSGLGDFIDSPLRTYSSGMYARLGFATATTWEPDILLLDEVLSVGDEAFRKKCEIRMKKFRNGKTTSILVSHSMESVLALCGRVAWFDKGIVRAIGPAKEVVAEYRKAQPGDKQK